MTTPTPSTPRLTCLERIAGTIAIIGGFGAIHSLVFLLEGANP